MYANYDRIKDLIPALQPFTGSSSSAQVNVEIIGSTGRLDEDEIARFRQDASLGPLRYVVRSYGTPIAWVNAEGEAHVVDQRFSPTTSRIQNVCRDTLTPR